ncbi:MAG: hypothetical protein GX265_00760 [Mollicutes bacterium]|nr:hypothetical protein [Mollicutes bacterium]
MSYPKVLFKIMSFEENIEVITDFIFRESQNKDKENTKYFKNHFTEISNYDFSQLSKDEINQILLNILADSWTKEMDKSQDIIDKYQQNWNEINDDVMKGLSKRLNINWPSDFSNIIARIGVLNACPRYINQRTFDIKITDDLNEMRMIVIHELCHFIYFEKWKQLFNDNDESHYNYPHLIWYLSEAIIDPLLNNNIFKNFTNNFEINSYDIFYKKMIDNESVVNQLRNILAQKSIDEGIIECYNFFIKNENIIKKGKSEQ